MAKPPRRAGSGLLKLVLKSSPSAVNSTWTAQGQRQHISWSLSLGLSPSLNLNPNLTPHTAQLRTAYRQNCPGGQAATQPGPVPIPRLNEPASAVDATAKLESYGNDWAGVVPLTARVCSLVIFTQPYRVQAAALISSATPVSSSAPEPSKVIE
ncbi:uncharacterized protein MAM_06830 [Metarhizium album ARSEF 1941]|uniref:Uncharacterized protein n=1 Tax=Metarhizium album (strain ARSEF 1941) TaxID=1081103 RepID=A0A0B2WH58_METAS|nr:uncharacterized protein MAM_06830 [Metarhizium album ARSEF 1941]KHN95326.1 hypothetical protein MAM_06830 [Metarhizium album ARSEF 1941]